MRNLFDFFVSTQVVWMTYPQYWIVIRNIDDSYTDCPIRNKTAQKTLETVDLFAPFSIINRRWRFVMDWLSYAMFGIELSM